MHSPFMPKLSLKLLMKSAIPICKFECDQAEPMLKTTILMMLANTMMPEAYEHGGKLAGIFTVLGFSVSVMVVLLERAP